jgi:predicted permease
MLGKTPGFTAVAILVLALGIGANGVVFSLINAAMLKPMNGGRHEDPVGLYARDGDRWRLFSYPEFVDLRSRNEAFTALFAESPLPAGVTENGMARRATASYVSSNYFEALGTAPAAGRFFTADEEQPASGAAVAVVNDSYWRRLGRPADIVGRPITVNGQTLTIVGLAPEGFNGTGPGVMEFWVPLGASSLTPVDEGFGLGRITNDRDAFSLMVAGFLEPGLSEQDAQARMAPLASALTTPRQQTNDGQQIVVQRRSRWDFGSAPASDSDFVIGAAVLMTIAGMVLVVACLNLVNLQLARGSARRQEIAVRLALGGSRLRIVRQLLAEGLCLSVIAGGVAIAITWWVGELAIGGISSVLQAPVGIDASPDGRMLAVIAAACVASTLVFSLGPALKLSRPDLVTAMKQAGPLPAARRRRVSLAAVLVGTQVALSLALMASAGVFARASINAGASDPGFALEGGVLADVDASIVQMDEAATRVAYNRVLDRLRSLPEVRTASAASIVPFGRFRDARMVRRNDLAAAATFTVVGSDYFRTLGLAVVAGREFTPVEEQRSTEPVVVVDRTLAERLFPAQSPLGEFVQLLDFDDTVAGEPLRIVGVVSPVRDDLVGTTPQAHVYVPYGRHFRSQMTFHVRTTPGLEVAIMARVREAIRSADPRLPVLAVGPMTTLRDGSPSLFALLAAATLFTAFGLIGLVLSAAGLYGLRAYLVSQRTRELGVRLALGATRTGVVSQLLKEGAVTAALGIVAGLALAVALVQVLRQSGMLYRVGLLDPMVMTTAPLVVAVVTLAASYLPARRALRIDPAAALRPE